MMNFEVLPMVCLPGRALVMHLVTLSMQKTSKVYMPDTNPPWPAGCRDCLARDTCGGHMPGKRNHMELPVQQVVGPAAAGGGNGA